MRSNVQFCLAIFGLVQGQLVAAQATDYSVGVAQPHLARARALAEEDNSWISAPLSACYPDDGQSSQMIIKDPAPTRAADNLYYVGNGMVAAWIIDTGAGLVLIDAMTNQNEVDRFILNGMKTLGLDPAQIKVIIVSHGHLDHFGGAYYLQERFGAKVYQSKIDQDVAERAARGSNGRLIAPRLDVAVTDGQTLTLGSTTIRMFVTPGHTPGGLSMIISIKDKGRDHKLAYFGGISSKCMPRATHLAYEESAARFARIARQEGADGFIANHPSFDGSPNRLARARLKPEMPSPFLVGEAATGRFLDILRECNLNNLDIETARPEASARALADRRPNPDRN